jgi:hypothetical protein
MAWQTLEYKLTSSCPLIQHNGQTADPLNKWAKLLKTISSKRKKTDADFEEMARIEFYAGLYLNAEGPIIPNTVIDGMTVKAAMKMKEGPVAKSGCFCLDHARLDYDGPRTADALWLDERFRFMSAVRVGQARVMRMRPRFPEWSAIIKLNVEDTLVNPAQVDKWMDIAGAQVGLGDWRPQFGRFTAERVDGS